LKLKDEAAATALGVPPWLAVGALLAALPALPGVPPIVTVRVPPDDEVPWSVVAVTPVGPADCWLDPAAEPGTT
jgi:hypothetical protein